jgi:CO/xanthine dehydrogenase Mo-binding subunit
MNPATHLGTSPVRTDAPGKVRGALRFTDDRIRPGTLHTAVLFSPQAHAEIKKIDTAAAAAAPGVRGVFTGADWPDILIGLYMGDKPPLARGKVRHHGEPVVAVVADDEASALNALRFLKVDYAPLPAVGSPRDAVAPGAPILHPDLASYARIPGIFPEPGTNVANRTKIRKGDVVRAFAEAEVVVEGEFSFPPGDHVAMEPRVAIAEYGLDGRLEIDSTTQSPFEVRNLLARALGLHERQITVRAAPIGGGFGGKAGILLEPLASLLAMRFPGRPVRLANTREADMLSSPGRPGLQARVRLAARADGTLLGADIEFLFDSGGYADYAVNVSRAAAISCTGPYNIPHVKADSLCVYTHHPFAAAFRGFGHIEMSYATERAMDLLAERLQMDPADLRRKNAIRRGDLTPTGAPMDDNTGDLPACLAKVRERLEWDSKPRRVVMPDGKIRAKGISCFWKAPAIPTFTDAGAVLYFAEDGSATLSTGVIEIGQGAHEGLRMLVAEALQTNLARVRVTRNVDTDLSPHDWATAASRSLFMAGRAALDAVADAIAQIKRVAAAPLRCAEADLEVAGGRVFLRDDPGQGLPLAQVVLGYVYPNGNAIGGPVIGRGWYITPELTHMDPATGAGKPWLEWTLGAEGVEVEIDPADGHCRVLKAACTMDVGKVVHPALARGQAVGAMGMGIGYSLCEGYVFNARETVQNGSLRDYKILRYGEDPEYLVDFIETPQSDGPYGLRGLGEQGIVGMPGCLSQAVSLAIGAQLTELPMTPETIWKKSQEAAT